MRSVDFPQGICGNAAESVQDDPSGVFGTRVYSKRRKIRTWILF